MSNVPFPFTLLPIPMQRHLRDAFFPNPQKAHAMKGSRRSSFPTVIVTPPAMDEHGQLIEYLHAEDHLQEPQSYISSLLQPSSSSQSRSWFTLDDSLWRNISKRLPPSIWDSQLAWLTLYFFTNLGLTLYNKMVLVRFPFPYTLTALHALCGSVGGYILIESEVFEPRKLTVRETVVMFGFSVLYTVNIAVSNLSLGLVTVPVRHTSLD